MSGMECEICSKKYTMVFSKWCKQCETNKLRKNFTNWTSGNEKIDNFIQEKQLEINNSWNIVFEWIPYNKFLDIKKVDKDDISTIYSVKWEDGPLEWNNYSKKYIRNPKEVEFKELKLKYSHNLQNVVEFLNEIKVYSTNFEIFGISQNPHTKDYIIALQNNYSYCIKCNYKYTNIIQEWCKQCETNKLITNWTSGNEKIDNFIQEKQLEIYSSRNIVFEWIPYNKFLDIKEVNKDDISTIYSAKWEDGPLKWNNYSKKYIRNPKEVELKELKLKYSHNLVVEFLNEIKVTNFTIFGISQNPDTKDYIIVLQNYYHYYCIKCSNGIIHGWCKQCETNKLKNFTNWSSGNKKIDNFIQKRRSKINNSWNIVFEWIPYNKFFNIKEVNKDDFSAVYLAQWKDGPLYWDKNSNKYIREPEKVALKCPYDSQNIDNFLNKVRNFSTK
ncbi:hypothetical protein RirG_250110 [Rhizophagus irregularis DAOM 197198w]|uniref:Uncharacterized protein n=1 Tax=Rhizophagus irregularis (strain DAOM 197198w) TaxID=1432141 RepID=A0A015I6U5_RHIIW|nr:hypothetical protein RirG_250110 [Rhizophagus irregularis DAOM 197198w]